MRKASRGIRVDEEAEDDDAADIGGGGGDCGEDE